tara:strand:+ start:528 stop:929 length:402 start_codon:yes stop_codon:yes gene_type:complete
MNDKRYKVNQTTIDSMRSMRGLTGLSYQKIADLHGVSYSIAYYWVNEKSRNQQREKNAKRKYSPKDSARIQRDMIKRKQNWKNQPNSKLRHTIQSAIGEKRIERKSVMGMNMKDAKAKIENGELRLRNNKMKD